MSVIANIMEPGLRNMIVEIGQKLVRYNLTYASLGNISARLNGNIVLITPSGIRFDSMTPEQIVKVNIENNDVISGGKPSTELPMHASIYKAIPEANAVIHAHTPYATALLTILGELHSDSEDAKTFGLTHIKTCKYAPPGTKELAKNVTEILSSHNYATVIPNHGAVVWGRDLIHALNVLEALENISRLEILKIVIKKKT